MSNTTPQDPSRVQLLKAKEVASMLSLPRTSIYDLIKTRNFPKPLKLGTHTSRWRLDAVENWIEQISEESTSTN